VKCDEKSRSILAFRNFANTETDQQTRGILYDPAVCVGTKTDTQVIAPKMEHQQYYTSGKHALRLDSHPSSGLLVGAAFDQPVDISRLAISGSGNQL
jgi:hypothetical protein